MAFLGALCALALSGNQPWRSALVLSGGHPPLALSGDQPLWSSAIPALCRCDTRLFGTPALTCIGPCLCWCWFLPTLNCSATLSLQRSGTLASACSRHLPVCWSYAPATALGFPSSRPLWRKNIFGVRLPRLTAIQVLGFFGAWRVRCYATLVLGARPLRASPQSSAAPVHGCSGPQPLRSSAAPVVGRSGARPLRRSGAQMPGTRRCRYVADARPLHGAWPPSDSRARPLLRLASAPSPPYSVAPALRTLLLRHFCRSSA